MALVLAAAHPLVIDLAVFLGFPAGLGALTIVSKNWHDVKKYLSSGDTSILLLPAAPKSRCQSIGGARI